MTAQFDVAVIGGGIVGLAHAWMAAKRNLRVLLLERTARAEGASIRNFGMIWPIGQEAGEPYAIALRSREFWLDLHFQGVLEAEQCGSVHFAHHADEMAVLEEFVAQNSHNARLLSAAETLELAPLANSAGLLGGLWSPTELRVDPRTASMRIAAWLSQRHGVQCQFETAVVKAADGGIVSSQGNTWSARRIIICSGSDLRTLYPEILAASGLRLCKLQMLKTAAQPGVSRPAPHVAGGLTLRHYQSFRDCPSLAAVKARIARQSPELDRYGIHVMASQRKDGEIILGDSHEYGSDITPFDKAEIDELMLRELRKIIRLENWSINQRWHGIYAKHPSLSVFSARTDDSTHIFLGAGGAGMTMAFGLAEKAWSGWEGR